MLARHSMYICMCKRVFVCVLKLQHGSRVGEGGDRLRCHRKTAAVRGTQWGRGSRRYTARGTPPRAGRLIIICMGVLQGCAVCTTVLTTGGVIYFAVFCCFVRFCNVDFFLSLVQCGDLGNN